MSGVAVVSGQIPPCVFDSTLNILTLPPTSNQIGQGAYSAAPNTAAGDPNGGGSPWTNVGTWDTDGFGGIPYVFTAPGTAAGISALYFPHMVQPLLFASLGQAGNWWNYRLQVWMYFSASPLTAGMCAQDTGFGLYWGGGPGVFDTTQANDSGNEPGILFQVNQADGVFHFISNPANSAAGHSAPAINRALRAPAAGWLNPFLLEVQILQAADGADAVLNSWLDGVALTSQSWTGGLLPTYLQGAGGGRARGMQAVIVSGSSVVANPQLRVSQARMRVGTVAAINLG